MTISLEELRKKFNYYEEKMSDGAGILRVCYYIWMSSLVYRRIIRSRAQELIEECVRRGTTPSMIEAVNNVADELAKPMLREQ